MIAFEQIGRARKKSSQRLSARRLKRITRRGRRRMAKGFDGVRMRAAYNGYWD